MLVALNTIFTNMLGMHFKTGQIKRHSTTQLCLKACMHTMEVQNNNFLVAK